MSHSNTPWFNTEDDGINNFDSDGDGIVDTNESVVDTNNDGIADYYSQIKGQDTDGDGTLDLFTEIVDSDLDGVIDTQNTFFDTNGDGIVDTTSSLFDSDKDGTLDAGQVLTDLNGDGIADSIAMLQGVDTNGDGIIDSISQQYDLNNDGIVDMEQISTDLNGDGIADMVSQTQYIDSDHNGIIDTISFAQDTNGDGYFDISTIAQDMNMDGLYEVVVNSQNGVTPDSGTPIYDPNSGAQAMNFDPDNADSSDVIGDPADSMDSWHLQETDSSCAVCAQEFVLEDLLDKDFTEGELRDFAAQHGWYSDNGTPMEDVGNILEAYGLDVKKHQDGSIEDIENCLENGGNVIVGVDADEIWYGDNDTFGPGDDANHALEVIGIDRSDPDNPMVILNDSGTPNGCGSMVPLDQFMDAWEDSDNFMVEAYN